MPIDLKKIGGFLKEKRETKGLTLIDVSNNLCIRKSLINAIESGDWQLLPHEIYVRGYLKEYANLLNVYSEIADDLVTQKEELKAPAEIPIHQQYVVSEHRQISKKALMYPLAFVLVVGFFILGQINRDEPAVPAQHTEHASRNIIDSSDSDMSSTVETSAAKKLMITCQERTWVSVVIDEIEKKEFMLNPEDIVILNAKATYDLLIGNAGGVKLILDGKDIQLTGVSGEVKRIKLS